VETQQKSQTTLLFEKLYYDKKMSLTRQLFTFLFR